MSVAFREAGPGDLAAVVALLADDTLGAGREDRNLAPYAAALEAMQTEPHNVVIVAETDGRVVASYQLTFISGLSHRGTRRAQVESVRVADHLRGRGIGRSMMADAEARARAAGCGLMQLTTDASRDRARAFYDSLGYEPSHIGYKRRLD